MTTSVCGRPMVLAMASIRWPLAAARVITRAEESEKSALPAITAFMAPGPATKISFTSTPCFFQIPRSRAT